MTSITAQTHATLDGVIDAPPAEALLPYMSDAGRQGALDLALAADALLLPRETWQGLARAWRDQTGPMAERLNAMPKYVVSATLGSADEWDHTTIVGYDEIAGLREREQLLTYGCGRLARDLLADGLLDVLVLSVTPIVAGAGRRLFDDPGHLVRLRLTDSTTFETGAVRLFLKPDRACPSPRRSTASHADRDCWYSSEAAVAGGSAPLSVSSGRLPAAPTAPLLWIKQQRRQSAVRWARVQGCPVSGATPALHGGGCTKTRCCRNGGNVLNRSRLLASSHLGPDAGATDRLPGFCSPGVPPPLFLIRPV